jgi:NAD(P)H-flavin reductase
MRWDRITVNHFELINGIKTIGIHFSNQPVRPGQSFICYSPRENGRLQLLVVCKMNAGMVWLSGGLFDQWQIGDELVIRGPIGSGFDQPPLVKNIVFGSFGEVSGVLIPLIWHGLKQQQNMTYALTYPSVDISAELELISIQEIGDVLHWADIFYFEIKREDGQADCMICSVNTKKGHRKTCKQGNVFWLGDLEDI